MSNLRLTEAHSHFRYISSFILKHSSIRFQFSMNAFHFSFASTTKTIMLVLCAYPCNIITLYINTHNMNRKKYRCKRVSNSFLFTFHIYCKIPNTHLVLYNTNIMLYCKCQCIEHLPIDCVKNVILENIYNKMKSNNKKICFIFK